MWRKWWPARPAEAPHPKRPEERSHEAPPPEEPRAERRGRPGLSEEDEALLERIAGAVVRWGMTVPAVFLLESSKPLSFVGSQFLHFLSPIVGSVLNARQIDRLAVMLERRETVEDLIVRIERAEDARRR